MLNAVGEHRQLCDRLTPPELMIRQANYSGHQHPTGLSLDSAVSVRVLMSVSVEVSAGAEMSGPQQTSMNRFFAGYSNKRDGEAQPEKN